MIPFTKSLHVLILITSLPLEGIAAIGPEPIRVIGKTMGTTYHITYFDDHQRDFTISIDSLFLMVNKSINTYDQTSEVSVFNRSERGVSFKLPYLYPPLAKAQEVYQASDGAFDPTVMPLVNAWGFGPETETDPDHHHVDSIRNFVGFDKISISQDSVSKSDPRVQLDFGGIGQGYGADVVSDYLRSKGIHNFLVELGGEGVASGTNIKTRKPWQVGITDPQSTLENQFLKAYVSLTDRSFTTAGNYFNYRMRDGKRYSHTIDPSTGYPADRNILSASVFSKDCMTADAWDTAFMVMGHERAIEVLKHHPELDALILYTGADGKIKSYVTRGMKHNIKIEP
ncbi:MAG: FAD:protein FMN transferase [Chryseolinea sp.]